MAYLSIPVAQMQTGPLGEVNCGPAIAEGLVLQGSVGALRVPARRIREELLPDRDGLTGAQLAMATNKLTGHRYPLVAMRLDRREQVRELAETTSGGIIISAAVTVRTKYATNRFTGPHWWRWGAGTIRLSDRTIKCEDPGTTYAGWFRVPLDLMFDAAEAMGALFVLRGVRTENIDRKAVRQGIVVRARPNRDSKVVKRLDDGEVAHVIRTVKGGSWHTVDGRISYGWHKIPKGFVKGEGLR